MWIYLLLMGILASYLMYKEYKVWNMIKNVPEVPGKMPILGHYWNMVGDFKKKHRHRNRTTKGHTNLFKYVKYMSNVANQLGGIAKVRLGYYNYFVVTDPAIAKRLLSLCFQKPYFYRFAKRWAGQGLVTGDVPIWKHHRKLINLTFSQKILDSYIGVFNTEAMGLVRNLSKHLGKGEFDPQNLFDKTAIDCICNTAIGLTEASTEKTEFLINVHQALQLLVKRVSRFWLHLDLFYYFSDINKEEVKVSDTLHDVADKILQKRRAKLKEESKNDIKDNRMKSFLDLLIETGEDGSLSDRDIREEMVTMILGGYDTVSASLYFAVVMLGTYPEVQDKAYKELKNYFKEKKVYMNKEDLNKLPYLEAILKEIIRLFPAVAVIMRNIEEDVEFENYTLPSGSSLIVPIYGVNRNKCWGCDAEEFNPERWLTPGNVPEGAYATFSFGKRNCVGKAYGLMFLKIVLSHLIMNYRMKSDFRKVTLSYAVLLKVEPGEHLLLEPRKSYLS